PYQPPRPPSNATPLTGTRLSAPLRARSPVRRRLGAQTLPPGEPAGDGDLEVPVPFLLHHDLRLRQPHSRPAVGNHADAVFRLAFYPHHHFDCRLGRLRRRFASVLILDPPFRRALWSRLVGEEETIDDASLAPLRPFS